MTQNGHALGDVVIVTLSPHLIHHQNMLGSFIRANRFVLILT